jgi:mannose-1-phosphate guanylyltransferase/mannose-6-phosphate isomerase
MVADRVLVVTEASQLELARAELPELGADDWIVEPARRGTAACLALAAHALPGDGVMVSLHADHLIPDAATFTETVRSAMAWADATGSLVTLGLEPRSPATGFGYIHAGEARQAEGRADARLALGFVEKPPLADAERMVQSGDYMWNLGIFAWRNRTFLEQLEQNAPDTAAGAATAAQARASGDAAAYSEAYLALPDVAVDHAVMERTGDLLVVPADFAWSDVGSWEDIRDAMEADGDGNAVDGAALVRDGGGNLVFAGDKLVALAGVSDLIVVATDDAILVCPRDRVQDVKLIVAELKRRGREDLL